jgi:hypothetical protein
MDRAMADYAAVISLSETQAPPAMTPEHIGSRLDMLEILTLRGQYHEAIARADETLTLFAANKEAMGLEPVVRLIKLAAKITGNVPSYRVDADELVTVSNNAPRRFTYGPFYWRFDTIDQFVADQPGVPDHLKCLFRQVSQAVQGPREPSEAACS